MKTDIETIKANLKTLVKDENVLKAVAEALSKKAKVKEPEEGAIVYYLLFDGTIENMKYNHDSDFFAWRTKQIFLTLKEIEDYKRFLLIEAQIREKAERSEISEDDLKFYFEYER